MLYRQFGKTQYRLSALGMGTNRFRVGNNVKEDICKSADAVYAALKNGVNYIDVAYNYSKGYAFPILRRAFEMAQKEHLEYHVTVKSAYKTDATAEDAYRRVLSSLQEMQIGKATFFVCWGIQSYDEYEKIMKPGGMYEGALEAKREGLVDSICFSTHAPAEDIIQILREGQFDGMTISYSALNYKNYKEVLCCAKEHGVGIITMNSLGGGIIPQNKDFFSFLQTDRDRNVEEGALRYIYAHDEITCCLSGMSSVREVENNLLSFERVDDYARERLRIVEEKMGALSEYCSGCNYCSGCPQEIPIRELMEASNAVYFPFSDGSYNRTDHETLKNISVTRKLNKDFQYIPQKASNPCVHCGACEKKCTQRLPIQEKLASLYQMFEETGYSRQSQKDRLEELLVGKGYERVGFIPSGGYVSYVLQLYREFFGRPEFEVFLFDNNPQLWGMLCNGLKIHNPAELSEIDLDLVVVANYIYADEIYDGLVMENGYRGKLVKLHREQDVPWVF